MPGERPRQSFPADGAVRESQDALRAFLARQESVPGKPFGPPVKLSSGGVAALDRINVVNPTDGAIEVRLPAPRATDLGSLIVLVNESVSVNQITVSCQNAAVLIDGAASVTVSGAYAVGFLLAVSCSLYVSY